MGSDDLDSVLADIDVDNEIAQARTESSGKKARGKAAAKPKKEPPKMIRAPDGSSFGVCDGCGKRCAAALLTQYGGHGHECDEFDPMAKLKELHAREKAKAAATLDRFNAAKQAARRELAEREPCKFKTAYHHFCAWRRVEIKDEKPDLDTKVITGLLADEWDALSAEKREKWDAMAAADKELFEERVAACAADEGAPACENDGEAVAKPKKASKKKAAEPAAGAEAKPKYRRAKTAFLVFCERNRARIIEAGEGLKMTEVSKALGAEWKALDSAGKAEYNEAYEEEKARLAANPELVPEKAKGGVKRKRQPKSAGVVAEDGGVDAPEAEAAEEEAEGEADEQEEASEEEEQAEEEPPAEAEAVPLKPKARKSRVVEEEDD